MEIHSLQTSQSSCEQGNIYSCCFYLLSGQFCSMQISTQVCTKQEVTALLCCISYRKLHSYWRIKTNLNKNFVSKLCRVYRPECIQAKCISRCFCKKQANDLVSNFSIMNKHAELCLYLLLQLEGLWRCNVYLHKWTANLPHTQTHTHIHILSQLN